MERQHEQLHVISIHFRPDASLVIPVHVSGEERTKDTLCAQRRAALMPAQGEVLFRHATAFPAVVEHIRALVNGDIRALDVGDDCQEPSQGPVKDDDHIIVAGRAIRCTGGQVYWW